MPPKAPIADLVGLAGQSRSTLLDQIKSLVDPSRDARELFLDDAGELKPAAARLLGRLAREAGLTNLNFEPDARRQDHMLGRQYIVRYLGQMVRLDVARLDDLQRKLGDTR